MHQQIQCIAQNTTPGNKTSCFRPQALPPAGLVADSLLILLQTGHAGSRERARTAGADGADEDGNHITSVAGKAHSSQCGRTGRQGTETNKETQQCDKENLVI